MALRRTTLFAIAATLGAMVVGSAASHAASHREAPLIAQDPTADITDFYAFRSWENPDRVVFILNVIPAQEPSSGPNYFTFSDDVLYAIHVDTNQDGLAEDAVYEIEFTTELRAPFDDLPVAYAGVDGVPNLPPAITALDGPGSEGLGLRQSYQVTQITGKRRGLERNRTVLGQGFAVPSNVGPRTMPTYESLAAQGIDDLSNGGRVFAGQRDETFYIDLGATFDTLNFRAVPILSNGDDANDAMQPFGVDMFSGFNVNTIAIEVPIASLTGDPNAVIGAYASTSRPRFTGRRGSPVIQPRDSSDTVLRGSGQFVQVARLANPLVNELVIGTGRKDVWNANDPSDEAQFIDFYLTSRLAAIINLAFGTSFPVSDRTDIAQALLRYPGQPTGPCSRQNPCAELLRLDLSVPPTPPASQKRLTVLAHTADGTPTPDPAGWPNGRRPNDDVTDIALRVVGGVLRGDAVPNLGDGVNFNIGVPGTGTTANGIATAFPFLPTPHDGRNRRHVDCGEPGGNPC